MAPTPRKVLTSPSRRIALSQAPRDPPLTGPGGREYCDKRPGEMTSERRDLRVVARRRPEVSERPGGGLFLPWRGVMLGSGHGALRRLERRSQIVAMQDGDGERDERRREVGAGGGEID